jgi:N-ethylmaleimide reductase
LPHGGVTRIVPVMMTNNSPLFAPFRLGSVSLPHRIVMAPMTRHRAGPGKVPSRLAAQYYAQRAGAALIITESTEVDPHSVGAPPTRPGIVTDAQAAAWQKVTIAVHKAGGRIFLQLSHMGRAAQPHHLSYGGPPRGPSAGTPAAVHYTADGPVPYAAGDELTIGQVREIIGQFGKAAELAKAVGFDGVELHGANGYLIDQFLRDGSNRRSDAYGGSPDNRFRFLAEIVEAALEHWPASQVGVRFSPTNPFQDMADTDPIRHFTHFAERLNDYRLAYLHVVEYPVQRSGRPEVARHLRETFEGPFIAAEGFSRESGEQWLREGRADLIAYGKAFLANPDLVERWWQGAPLNEPDKATFYTTGARGYTDYPKLAEAALEDPVGLAE